jgi:hypothetical protein
MDSTTTQFGTAPRREGGQAMVEFLLVMVLVFVVFLSIVQMILLMYAYNTIADAAKEGVRVAIVHGTGNSPSGCYGPGNPSASNPPTCSPGGTSNVQRAVVNFAAMSFQNVTTSDVTVDYTTNNPTGGCSAPGCYVKVSVSHTYTPLFSFSWPSFALNASADGRIMN